MLFRSVLKQAAYMIFKEVSPEALKERKKKKKKVIDVFEYSAKQIFQYINVYVG